MKLSASLPTGVAALFFESARRRRRLEDRLVGQLEAAGFQEVILPVVDYLDPYEELLSPVSRSELYRFIDRDGEVLALRSDFTPMLARLLAPRLPSLELPLELYYRGDVLRYQEERAGRERELYQLGVEVLGRPGDEGERLALHRFLELLTAGDGSDVVVVLGFAGALDRLLLAHREPLAPWELAGAVARRERHLVRDDPALLEVIERGAPRDPRALGEAAAGRLESLRDLRRELAAAFPSLELTIDLAEFAEQALAPELLRGVGARAYYDGLVFRAFGGARALPLGSGGRYDRLFLRLEAEVTAAGFSLSLDRLASLIGGGP